MLVDLIRAGLATANTERMVAGGRPIEVTRVRITDAGQRTHEDRTPTHGYAATRLRARPPGPRSPRAGGGNRP
jgi:hypothetical protein